MSSDILTNGPKPSPEFMAALETAKDCAYALRSAIFALVRSAPSNDPAAWVATMTDPVTAESLGEISLLCDAASAGARESIPGITGPLSTAAPSETIDEFARGVVRGMTAAAMSCNCGACGYCNARRIDPEGAEYAIGADMANAVGVARPKPRIRLVKG